MMAWVRIPPLANYFLLPEKREKNVSTIWPKAILIKKIHQVTHTSNCRWRYLRTRTLNLSFVRVNQVTVEPSGANHPDFEVLQVAFLAVENVKKMHNTR